MDENIGKMKALLDTTQKQTEENKKLLATISDMAVTMTIASREIDDLRGIVGDISVLIKENKRSDWITTGELSKRLGVSKKTVLNWYHSGKIPGHRAGEKSYTRFDYTEVSEALRALPGA